VSIYRYGALLRYYGNRVERGEVSYFYLAETMLYKSSMEAARYRNIINSGNYRRVVPRYLETWLAREIYWEMEMIKLRHCE
jgi:hypothetical protein